jgi:hypothetical protein
MALLLRRRNCRELLRALATDGRQTPREPRPEEISEVWQRVLQGLLSTQSVNPLGIW